MYLLRVLGGFSLVGPSGDPVTGLSQRRAEALLAVIAAAGAIGCTRERLMALLWPEMDEAHARHSLSVLLHTIRQCLGADAILGCGGALCLNSSVVLSDIAPFVQSPATLWTADVVESYGGPLLDGFHVDEAPGFEHWLDGERARLGREYAEALERLAGQTEAGGDWTGASAWWARAVEHDPDNTRLVIRLMRTLAAAGDRANALRHAEAHRLRLKAELSLAPGPELQAEIVRIRDSATSPRV